MNEMDNPICVFLYGVLIDAYSSKELRTKIEKYASYHGSDGTLSTERKKWQLETDSAVARIRDLDTFQFRPFVRHRPTEIQYFLFERIAVACDTVRLNPHLLEGPDLDMPLSKPLSFGEMLFRLLQDLWNIQKETVVCGKQDFDEYVYGCFARENPL